MQILTTYYSQEREQINFGDYITIILLKHLGYSPIILEQKSCTASACLLGVGTILSKNWIDLLIHYKKRAVIWGSGYDASSEFKKSIVSKLEIHTVRGPLSKRLLGLPDSLPFGDPGLFLPQLQQFDKKTKTVFCMPHFLDTKTMRQLDLPILNPFIKRNEWWSLVEKIATAEFLLTNCLHGAIVAQAYGVPWAKYEEANDVRNCPVKWLDWLESLGIEKYYKAVTTMKEGLHWWENYGRHGITPTVSFDTFPKDCDAVIK